MDKNLYGDIYLPSSKKLCKNIIRIVRTIEIGWGEYWKHRYETRRKSYLIEFKRKYRILSGYMGRDTHLKEHQGSWLPPENIYRDDR